jgi:hypothetical protein
MSLRMGFSVSMAFSFRPFGQSSRRRRHAIARAEAEDHTVLNPHDNVVYQFHTKL